MKSVVILVLIGVIVSASLFLENAHALDYKYGTTGYKFNGTPTFCTIEPQEDSALPKNIIPLLLKETKSSVGVWTSALKLQGGRDDKWDINYVSIPNKERLGFDYSKCDVTITYQRTPPPDYDKYIETNGWYYNKGGKGYIDIFYLGRGICEERTPGILYWKTCYYDTSKLISYMGPTLQHEVGHALGLDHYISTDVSYLTNEIFVPSIMVPYHPDTQSKNYQIRPIDVLKLKEIYGQRGWGFGMQASKQKTSEPTLDFSHAQTKKISLERGNTSTEILSGKIPKESYVKGKGAEIVLIKPNGQKEIQKTMITKDGKFQYMFLINDRLDAGKYNILVTYDGKEIKRLIYEIVKKWN